LVLRPAALVRGQRYVSMKGKTPVLTAVETRQLLDSNDTSTAIGLRDRTLMFPIGPQATEQLRQRLLGLVKKCSKNREAIRERMLSGRIGPSHQLQTIFRQRFVPQRRGICASL
jgi:hypothetical protein